MNGLECADITKYDPRNFGIPMIRGNQRKSVPQF
jgi:hypothetical protein